MLRPLMTEFNQCSEDLMELLAKQADGKTMVRLQPLLNLATLDVIGKVAFGMDINSLEKKSSPFQEAVSIGFQGLSESIKSLFAHKIPFLQRKFKKEVREAVRLLRETGKKLIAKREEAIAKGDPVPQDILCHMIEILRTNPSVDIEVAVDDFVTFFIAGQETTTNTLSFAIRELGRRPDIMQKLQKEVDTVLGGRRDVSFEDMSKFEYMGRFIKEVLRVYPPVTDTFRCIDKPFSISGFDIPLGTEVVLSSYICARYNGAQPDQLTFDPDRFVKDSETKPPTYSYFPFLLGPRSCIGMNFAQIEMKVILAKFIQRLTIEPDPSETFEVEEVITLQPKGGVPVKMSLRDV